MISKRPNSVTTSPSAPLFEHQGMLLGGDPSAEDLVQAVADGFKVLVDLRAASEIDPDERRRALEAIGLSFFHVPVAAASDLHDAARALHDVLTREQGPFIIHCKSGNRVGAALAVRAHEHLGCSPEESIRIGVAAGMKRLEPEVRALLGC